MAVRLVALDEGSDIPLNREMLVVGRHPQCDARLDSIRVSRRHCCMSSVNGEIMVIDLGSTNGIRINGQRVEKGLLRPGDELSIAHIRYRFEDEIGQEMTMAEPMEGRVSAPPAIGSSAIAMGMGRDREPAFRLRAANTGTPPGGHAVMVDENPLAAAVREMLPSNVADKCRIQVIVQMPQDASSAPALAPAQDAEPCPPASSP